MTAQKDNKNVATGSSEHFATGTRNEPKLLREILQNFPSFHVLDDYYVNSIRMYHASGVYAEQMATFVEWGMITQKESDSFLRTVQSMNKFTRELHVFMNSDIDFLDNSNLVILEGIRKVLDEYFLEELHPVQIIDSQQQA